MFQTHFQTILTSVVSCSSPLPAGPPYFISNFTIHHGTHTGNLGFMIGSFSILSFTLPYPLLYSSLILILNIWPTHQLVSLPPVLSYSGRFFTLPNLPHVSFWSCCFSASSFGWFLLAWFSYSSSCAIWRSSNIYSFSDASCCLVPLSIYCMSPLFFLLWNNPFFVI